MPEVYYCVVLLFIRPFAECMICKDLDCCWNFLDIVNMKSGI